jgi:hypothetical protein
MYYVFHYSGHQTWQSYCNNRKIAMLVTIDWFRALLHARLCSNTSYVYIVDWTSCCISGLMSQMLKSVAAMQCPLEWCTLVFKCNKTNYCLWPIDFCQLPMEVPLNLCLSSMLSHTIPSCLRCDTDACYSRGLQVNSCVWERVCCTWFELISP